MMLHNRYWLVRTVGKGGFAIVYEAIDMHDNRRVAIKEIPLLSSGHGDQIEREIHILSEQVSDLPFVPDIYEYWNQGGKMYLVMEWIDGQTVWEMCNDRWPAERVEHFLRTVLGYLTELHARGIVHRDLHPKNIKLDPQKNYVLLDFGIAKEGMHTLTMAKAAQPRYAPLEQLTGDTTDVRSDLYTLGATAYHLLTGAPPPTALERRYEGVPLRLSHDLTPNVPAGLETTLLGMLELESADRPATADEALRMLDQPVALPPSARMSRQPAAPRRPMVPPVRQSRHAPSPDRASSWGCISLLLMAGVLLVIGGFWFSDRLGSTINPITEVVEPVQASRSPAPIATQARLAELAQPTPTSPAPTKLAQPTPTSPAPTKLPQPTPTSPAPTETSSPSRSSSEGMHSVTTAKGLDNTYRPLRTASTFTTNEQIYISYQISEAEQGEAVTFKCFFNDVLWWERVNRIAQGGNYTGYFVIGPLNNPGTYRGELAYKGEIHRVYWNIR